MAERCTTIAIYEYPDPSVRSRFSVTVHAWSPDGIELATTEPEWAYDDGRLDRAISEHVARVRATLAKAGIEADGATVTRGGLEVSS